MKSLIILAFLLPVMGSYQASLSDISRAISAGDADALGRFFDDSVEIAVADEEDVYDKGKAISIVRTFFAAHKPRSFSQVHQGTSKGNESQYTIGNLVTEDATYRVYLYLQVIGDRYVIQELRFDEE